MKVLLLAFTGTVAQTVAEELAVQGGVTVRLVPSEGYAIKQLCASLNVTEYDLVVGLGAYTGRDKSGAVRVEQTCTDKFRNSSSTGRRIHMTHHLPLLSGMKYADGIGNSYCNLLSYQFLATHPKVPAYCFLHIPQGTSTAFAASVISAVLPKGYQRSDKKLES